MNAKFRMSKVYMNLSRVLAVDRNILYKRYPLSFISARKVVLNKKEHLLSGILF